ncbi:MAG: hybrid sensor histidine kinase/response regulator [Gallionella sp.]|nr:MAG: hybrid sensor histidine kinase/response regulator [Gallionella sp.]
MSEKFTILVVDDNANNRFTLRALLARLPDCDVVEAESGERALILTVEHDIHLVLLDVQMPGMDGFETARHLQMTERTRHIPIVFITAVFTSETFAQHGFASGAVDYLTKPLDDNLLLSRVRLYQRLHHQKQELEVRVEQLQRQEQALATACEAAEAANHAKSMFLSNMSHELRTPLNAILGFAQLMEHDPLLTEHHRRELETIHRSGHHLLALINDVLEISRIEAGRTTVHNEDFDLADALRSIEEMIRIRAEHKALEFTIERCGQLPHYVRGDAHHLRQVLLNLLGNAVKYTDHGRICLRLVPNDHGAHGMPDTEDRIRFEVIDSGPGIAPEEQQRIFQAFYQTKAGADKGEGSGLGLTISREFVRLMGGELTVHSEPGQGSVFAFSLPLPEAEAPAITAPQFRVIGLAEDQPPVRVLVAEDNADNRELITMLLRDLGVEVRGVENGRQAIEIFQAWQPHFIWMDMRMPVLDGYEATKIIRSLPGGVGVKIAALTASAFREDQTAILAAGCDDMLVKPIDASRLYTLMGELLGLRYRYADAPASATTPQQPAAGANLADLPEALRRELLAAAEMLDTEAIHAVVERIRPERPELARAIAAWVEAYRFDAVATLCRNGDPPPVS